MKTVEQLGISQTPWHAIVKPIAKKDIGWVYDKNDRAIFGVMQPSNAHLMAAAPELYEALAALLNCAEKEAPFTRECLSQWTWRGRQSKRREAMREKMALARPDVLSKTQAFEERVRRPRNVRKMQQVQWHFCGLRRHTLPDAVGEGRRKGWRRGMTAEYSGPYYDHNGSFAFTIVVHDGEHRVILHSDSSSLYPRVGHREREPLMERFADRIVEAINRGGAQ